MIFRQFENIATAPLNSTIDHHSPADIRRNLAAAPFGRATKLSPSPEMEYLRLPAQGEI